GGAAGATAPGAHAASPTAGPAPGQAHGAHPGKTAGGAGTTDAKADMPQDGGKVDGVGGGSLGDSGEGTAGQDSVSGSAEAGAAAAYGGPRVGEKLGAMVPPPPVAQMSGPGNSVRVGPPPTSERTPDAAQTVVARSLQAEFNGSPVSAIATGSPPTVALGSKGGPRILTNTANQRLARAGYQAWRTQGVSPSYLRDGGGSSPEGSGPESPSSQKTSAEA